MHKTVTEHSPTSINSVPMCSMCKYVMYLSCGKNDYTIIIRINIKKILVGYEKLYPIFPQN